MQDKKLHNGVRGDLLRAKIHEARCPVTVSTMSTTLSAAVLCEKEIGICAHHAHLVSSCYSFVKV